MISHRFTGFIFHGAVFPLKILLWPLNRPNPTKLTDPICSQVNTATHLQQTEKCKSLCKTKNLLCARQRLYRESNNNIFPALLYFLHNHLSLGLGTLLISYYDCDAQLARWARRIFWFITCNAVWFLKKLNHLLMAFLSHTGNKEMEKYNGTCFILIRSIIVSAWGG